MALAAGVCTGVGCDGERPPAASVEVTPDRDTTLRFVTDAAGDWAVWVRYEVDFPGADYHAGGPMWIEVDGRRDEHDVRWSRYESPRIDGERSKRQTHGTMIYDRGQGALFGRTTGSARLWKLSDLPAGAAIVVTVRWSVDDDARFNDLAVEIGR